MLLEGTLVEKLRKLEALHAGTTVAGEKEAAKLAAERIRARLAELRAQEKEVVMLYRLPDPWMRRLFIALCRRYDLKPYRDRGRRVSTIQVRAPKTFHDKTLWPEFVALSKELKAHLEALTEQVIKEAIHDDTTEPPEAKALPPGSAESAESAEGVNDASDDGDASEG